ncbi:g11375 [Coccomyxa elongata]
MQQLAEGTLLQPSADKAEEKPPAVADNNKGLEDMLISGLESFPISSCNAWGLPSLSNRLSLGLPTDSWSQPAQANEWLARIARPPTPKFEAAIPEEEEVKVELSNEAAVSQWLGTPLHKILQTSGAEAMPAAAQGSFMSMLLSGSMNRQPEPALGQFGGQLQNTAGQSGGQLGALTGQVPPFPTLFPTRAGGNAPAGGSDGAPGSAGDASHTSHEQAESRDPGGKRRSKEEVQKRNKEAQQRFRDRQKAKLKEAEDAADELRRQLEAVVLQKKALEEQLQEFSRTLSQRDELIAQLRAGREVAGAAAEVTVPRFPCNVTITVYPNQDIRLSRADIVKLQREELVGIWKEYVNALSNLLPSGLVQLSETAAQAVTRLALEATQLMLCVADSSPAMFKSFAACKLDVDTSSEHGEDSLQLWGAVTGYLQLTPKQREDLMQMRIVCLASLSTMIDERNSIHAFLTGAMPAAVGARQTAAQYLKAHEGIEQLKLNLKKEHDLKVDWMTAVFCTVFTPEQVARAIVHSYPWAPDTMAVAAVVAAEGGDAEALTHLRADCSGGPGAYVQARSNSNSLGSNITVEGLRLGMQREGSDKCKRLLVSTPFSQDSPPEATPG